jgi:hypothetical protein
MVDTTLEIVDYKSTFDATDEYPWSPLDEREFWCKRLGNFVRMTGNLNTGGIYYVTIPGSKENSGRQYPVLGRDIVLADSKEAKKIDTDDEFLSINKANWSQIKNFMCDRFIHSYPWQRTQEKTTEEVRNGMIVTAKSPRAGLAKMIENERNNNGYFLDITTFIGRMQPQYESFPWRKFASCLEFSTPIT